MMTGNGNPKKVLRKAAELGVHADCIAADIEGSCGVCAILLHSIYDFFYGHLESSADFIAAVLDDLRADRTEEFS